PLAHSYLLFFFFMIRLPPISTLFPYTTLFRSIMFFSGEPGASIPGIRERIQVAFGANVYDCSTMAEMTPWMTAAGTREAPHGMVDRKSTRLNSSHRTISYAVFCLKKKKKQVHR